MNFVKLSSISTAAELSNMESLLTHLKYSIPGPFSRVKSENIICCSNY